MAEITAVHQVLTKVESLIDPEEHRHRRCRECESNASDHKGPCNNCENQATYREIQERALAVLAIKDPLVFDHEATEFLEIVRGWAPWVM